MDIGSSQTWTASHRKANPHFPRLCCLLYSRGASGGSLHGGASFKREKASFKLLHENRVRLLFGRPLKSSSIIGVPKSEFFECAFGPLSSHPFPLLFPLQTVHSPITSPLSPFIPLLYSRKTPIFGTPLISVLFTYETADVLKGPKPRNNSNRSKIGQK